MQPLADKMRPLNFNDVVGQDHLVGKDGIINKMVLNNKPLSFILHGKPGSGKTTIANIFVKSFNLEHHFFNASTDNKATLQSILKTTSFNNIIIVIDEVHRMKTDIQDYLLPFIETGKAILVGLTTENPYYAINYAIRSRVNIYEIKEISSDDIKKTLFKALNYLDFKINIKEDAFDLIIRYSGNEIRTALNLLEASSLYLEENDFLTTNIVRRVINKPNFDLDKDKDNFYNLLSALQKSIRGSDVDASVFYLARLLLLEDLKSISRRLLVIAYEDIGLAQPGMGEKVLAAVNAANIVGMPEARIILANIVIDMAISPKSNSAYLAIDRALDKLNKGNYGSVPKFLDNNYLKTNPDEYHYPHDDQNSVNNQRHLPDKNINDIYYIPKDNSIYEKALKNRLEDIDKIKLIKNRKKED